MDRYESTKGEGRTKVNLSACFMGNDLIICIYNGKAHIGAVAVGEYDHEEERASISVITRLGHKDDAIARKAAYLISRHIKGPSCVIAGVHLTGITEEEIQKLLKSTDSLVEDFVKCWEQRRQ